MPHSARKLFVGLSLAALVALLAAASFKPSLSARTAALQPCYSGGGHCYIPAPSIHNLAR
ncbi:hypothetical protein D3880_00370 [Pseudomonas cavernae]|uniref:Uncharacterized protein n=1 Tax=Pseudomonas cavernae TaxID=2320867 RepID=A0A385YWV5_9PSED|nr:hypothetical protein [Pseudomonas cavernae]AYC30931.1 hypothetical protein D3880_00370 [Pseudomonas cavernae]